MTKISFTNPKGVDKPVGYTHVACVENPKRILFISGQVARDENGQTVGKGDLQAQTRQVYKNLSTILSSFGSSFKSVVKQNTYTTRVDQIETIKKVRGEFLQADQPPTSTLVGVTALADPDFMIEVEVVAALE